MARGEKIQRRAEKAQSARSVGRDWRIPKLMASHISREIDHTFIMSLPEETVASDITDSNGNMIWIPGISEPGHKDFMR